MSAAASLPIVPVSKLAPVERRAPRLQIRATSRTPSLPERRFTIAEDHIDVFGQERDKKLECALIDPLGTHIYLALLFDPTTDERNLLTLCFQEKFLGLII